MTGQNRTAGVALESLRADDVRLSKITGAVDAARATVYVVTRTPRPARIRRSENSPGVSGGQYFRLVDATRWRDCRRDPAYYLSVS